eukprot:scaffold25228_cov56-Phaeocystis_antarctica.AAC.2
MKPIGPSVPLTRPSLSFRLRRNSRPPSFARPPLQPHPQPGHSLGTRACAVPNYSKFRWLYSGRNQRFSTLFRKNLPRYQPRALCAVASHLLPGLRCEEDFCRGFWLPHGPVYPLQTRCQCVWPSPVACVAARRIAYAGSPHTVRAAAPAPALL